MRSVSFTIEMEFCRPPKSTARGEPPRCYDTDGNKTFYLRIKILSQPNETKECIWHVK